MIDRDQFSNVLTSLNADQLRRRLDELDGERAAVATLLRAARGRERGRGRAGVNDRTQEEARREER